MIEIKNTKDIVTINKSKDIDYFEKVLLNQDLNVPANTRISFETGLEIKCDENSEVFIVQECDDIYKDIIVESDRIGEHSTSKTLSLSIVNISSNDITVKKDTEICVCYKMINMIKDLEKASKIYNDGSFILFATDKAEQVKKVTMEYNDITQEKHMIIEL